MKIGIDIDGVILDYQRVLNTYGDLYDFIELKKDGIVSKNELYLRKKYNWTDEERMNFVNKYFLKLSKQTHLIPGAKDVINMLKNEENELIIISARGGMIEEMKDVAINKFEKDNATPINNIAAKSKPEPTFSPDFINTINKDILGWNGTF